MDRGGTYGHVNIYPVLPYNATSYHILLSQGMITCRVWSDYDRVGKTF